MPALLGIREPLRVEGECYAAGNGSDPYDALGQSAAAGGVPAACAGAGGRPARRRGPVPGRGAGGGARHRSAAGRRGRRCPQRRRGEQAQLRHVRQGPADRLRRGGLGRRDHGIGDGGPGGVSRLRREDGPDHGVRADHQVHDLRRAGLLRGTGRATGRYRQPQGGYRRRFRGGHVHERRLPRGHRGVLAEPVLRQPGRVPGRARRGDAGGIRGRPPRGLHPAGGLPRPGHDRAGRRLAGELPPADGTQHRGAQPGAGKHPRRDLADPHLLGQHRDAADQRCRAQGHHRHHPQGQAPA